MTPSDSQINQAQNQIQRARLLQTHLNHEVDKLISCLAQETNLDDPLKLVGRRYRQKNEEHNRIRQQNMKLKNELRHLKEQLQQWRFRQYEGQIDGTNICKMLNYQQSSTDIMDEDISNQLSQVEKYKSEAYQASINYQQKLQEAYEFFQRQLSILQSKKSLQFEIKGSDKIMSLKQQQNQIDEQFIYVPKKRYMQLIQIYSLNTADTVIKNLKLRLNRYKRIEQSAPSNSRKELEEQRQISYQQIIKSEQSNVQDMGTFFQILSRKIGFENEWKRYHQQNVKEGLKMKSQMQAIVKGSLSGLQDEKQILTPKQVKIQFHNKINKIVQYLPFSNSQKQQWQSIFKKIKDNEHESIQQMIERAKQEANKAYRSLANQFSAFICQSVYSTFNHFQTVLKPKLHKKEFSRIKSISHLISQQFINNFAQKLSQCIGSKDRQKIKLDQCEMYLNNQRKVIVDELSKKVVFFSTIDLYNLAKR